MIQPVMREHKEFLLGESKRAKQSVKSGNYTRLLVVLTYLAAIGIALFIGTIKKGNDIDLLVILLMLVAAIPLLRDGNTLNQPSRTTYRFGRLRAVGPWRLRSHKTRKRLRRLVLPWNKRLNGWWHPLKS
jgi:hypothetical protein